MNVLPEYLEGNRTGSYTPEQWLDEVKDKNSDEIIQEGTPMDAEHFNHKNNLSVDNIKYDVKHSDKHKHYCEFARSFQNFLHIRR